jgi:gamma-glutamyl-gamma-aminobutyrate hydrolase PuuD
LINVACGGTLYQDISEQYPGAGQHRDDVLFDGFHHDIEIVAGSYLETLYPGRRIGRVNSIHHQAIRKLGSDLVIDAKASDDGVVEAIRWVGNGYMLGCQWHPEFQSPFSELLDSGPIMSDFLAAARKAKNTTPPPVTEKANKP